MSILQSIWSITTDLDTQRLLNYLIRDRYPGNVIVSASLKARSVVVLKMIADIEPSTPVVFCRPTFEFEDSRIYRERIVDLLGLTDVKITDGQEVDVGPGDQDHVERMWVSNRDLPGESFILAHLNDSLKDFACWISAVNHVRPETGIKHRVDLDGRLVRVDPIIRWSDDDVRAFMRDSDLPYHKMAKRTYPKFQPDGETDAPWHAY